MIDVLVLGTGRSGTSTTCRILHETYGVCFGHNEVGKKNKRGETIWEDAVLKNYLKETLGGARSVEEFHLRVLETHQGHDCRVYGLKLLDLCLLGSEDIKSFNPSLVVRTYRPRESCLRSWRRPGWRTDVEFHYDRREARCTELEFALDDVRKVFFDPEQRTLTEEDVLRQIGKWER